MHVNLSKYFITVFVNIESYLIFLLSIVYDQDIHVCSPHTINTSHPCNFIVLGFHRNLGSVAGRIVGDF